MSLRSLLRTAPWVLALALVVVAAACGLTPTESSEGTASPVADASDQSGEEHTGSSGDDSPAPPADEEDMPIEVDTLYRSTVSGLTESTRAVIASQSEWETAWADLTSLLAPAPEAPSVDFDSAQVVVLALGQRSSGGYGIELAAIERAEGAMVITVREVAPGAGCVTTQALSQPVLAFALAIGSDEVQFRDETLVRDCF